MKKNYLVLVLLLIAVPASTLEQVQSSSITPQSQDAVFDPLFNDPELDRFLNPSESEEEYVYSIQQPPPPGKLLVWMRIIGVPIINAFFAVRRAVRESFAWILAALKLDKKAQDNAQS